jgi:dihydrofolate synthase/folylpolyglutamate synthase
MDYPQTIDYLFSRLPMFSRIGQAAYKKDLTHTIDLCRYLGDPQNKFRTVHIAGTNGKGSVSHMLAAIFQLAGYKTGLYTSPHLKDFRERIKINGREIDKGFVVDFTQRIRPLSEEIDPSFFEMTVAMAYDYFAQQRVDIAFIEVGLGGRFDSTNIIHPELSVITNIGYDHMNILGNTLELIASEKAGIIKAGVPVVIGEKGSPSDGIFEEIAKGLGSPLCYADQVRFVADWQFDKHSLVAEVTTVHNNDKQHFRLDLTGLYQLKNLITVLEAVEQLTKIGWTIPSSSTERALAGTRRLTGLHGRWEVIHERPMIVLDVGHNEDGIRQVSGQIEITDHENLHLIIGFVRDKEIDRILSLLPREAEYYFSKAQIPRAMPEDQLAAQAAQAGLHGQTFPEVNEALRAAREKAGPRDLILVCGSVFLVGEVQLHAGVLSGNPR